MDKKVFAFLHCLCIVCCYGILNVPYCGETKYATQEIEMKAYCQNKVEKFPDHYPWMVSIQTVHHAIHVCWGSVITERWILTTAHYMYAYEPGDIQGIVGPFTTPQVIQISKIFEHFDFDFGDNTILNDIALLKTAEKMNIDRFSGFLNNICLPQTDSEPFGLAKVIGYTRMINKGERSSGLLRDMVVRIIDMQICNETYGKMQDGRDIVHTTMICAGMERNFDDFGDNGSPLFQTVAGVSTIIGIASNGMKCADKNFPGLYTKVSAYLPWIEDVIFRNL